MSTRTRANLTSTLPDLVPQSFPGFGEDSPLDLTAVDEATARQIGDLLTSPGFDAWSEALARVGNCSRPIRLHGHSTTVDTATGEIVGSYASSQEPLGVTHVRCGNRRARCCASCSRLHAGDTYHLIHAGVAGGKTVPVTVAENPLVFATVTAPSFGPVHGHRPDGRRCHPHRPAQPGTTGQAHLCRHGRPRTCMARHAEDDPSLGQPLCPDCYDYASQAIWQWWAPDLWRRFTISLRRLVARTLGVPASRLGEVATVQYAKVAEYQLRGVVHFHALVRLDGPKTPDGFAPAPSDLDAELLAGLVQQAAASVRLTVPGADGDDPSRAVAFGRQLDARPVRITRRTDDPERALSPEQVAGYLAKYATKSADDTGAFNNPHHRRIRATTRSLAIRARAASAAERPATESPYALLGKWVHMLGFRGHFASKSRRYSITLGALRRARRRAQALIAESRDSGRPLDLAALEADLLADEDADTTLVIGQWTYAGTGWATEGQRVLANAAAARAREYDQWKAERRRARRTREKGQGCED